MTTLEKAYNILRDTSNVKDKNDLETIISQDAEHSYLYARDIIKGKWIKGEKVISQDALYSCLYARYIIKGKWIKGEKAICQSTHYSCYYAMDVIKDRWIKGEKAISQNPRYSYYYAKYVIKGELPEFMHKKMIIHGIVNSEDAYVKDYFEFIE
jgi:endogenous inhibitor of DNA gyrase (YacG/DUF329 family)